MNNGPWRPRDATDRGLLKGAVAPRPPRREPGGLTRAAERGSAADRREAPERARGTDTPKRPWAGQGRPGGRQAWQITTVNLGMRWSFLI